MVPEGAGDAIRGRWDSIIRGWGGSIAGTKSAALLARSGGQHRDFHSMEFSARTRLLGISGERLSQPAFQTSRTRFAYERERCGYSEPDDERYDGEARAGAAWCLARLVGSSWGEGLGGT